METVSREKEMKKEKEVKKELFDEFMLNEKKKTAVKTLYIGMDLGTSRSAIATNTGVRVCIPSLVGWPKDTVSRKLLGKDVIFGDEAMENRLSVDLIRPLEKGVIKHSEIDGEKSPEASKYEEAARQLIQHIINMAHPEEYQQIFGVIGAPAQASIHNKKAIIKAAREVLDAVLIVSEPFSVAYGLNKLNDTLMVDIGAGTTDLCRMHGAIPAEDDQITIYAAGDYVDDYLFRLLQQRFPEAQFSVNMIKKYKENHGFVQGVDRRVEVELLVNGRPQPYDITDMMRDSCNTLVKPILNAIHKLVSTFDPEFQYRLRNNVILAGGGSQMLGLDRAVEEGLKELGGGKVHRVEEPMYGGANGALKLAQEMPMEYWEKLS
jgi:rod shape-determining protein MreB